MKKQLTAAIAASVLSAGGATSALAVEEKVHAAPVDFRACNFQDGKSMKDLDKVAAKFRAYANKSDVAYAAWTLVPEFHNGANFDVAWLGAWPDSEAYGVSMEKWRTSGRDIAAEFDQVIDCDGRHELAMSFPISAPEGTPEDGVLMFYQCTVHEGKTMDMAYKAHLDAGTAMKGLGSLAVSWMFRPAAGGGDKVDFDYYHVVGFYRYSDLGATMEMYTNGGGIQAQQAILGEVTSCESPVVFDAVSVRARDER